MTPVELNVDVTEAAGLGHAAHTAVTVYFPEGNVADPAVVCFAFPGGGYSRHYYSLDSDEKSSGGQAGFHTQRGWIFVACDHLGVGDSTIPADDALDFENVAQANHATVKAVMSKLEAGTLNAGFAPVTGATVLGIGQSMGGCLTIVAQGQLCTFDGVGTLGYSGVHQMMPHHPRSPAAPWPWIVRGSSLATAKNLNRSMAMPFLDVATLADAEDHPWKWWFHYDDEPAEMVACDMAVFSGTAAPLPLWRSATIPKFAAMGFMLAPGAVATEAASITVPVFIGIAERDFIPDPWAEPKAFKSASDITLFVCPGMSHMHNFAHTRLLFWQKLHSWGSGVAAMAAFK